MCHGGVHADPMISSGDRGSPRNCECRSTVGLQTGSAPTDETVTQTSETRVLTAQDIE